MPLLLINLECAGGFLFRMKQYSGKQDLIIKMECDKNYVRVIFITKFISCYALHKLGYSPSWLAANAVFLKEV